MAHSTRTIPLLVASIIAIVLVGGAYVFSGPIPFIDRVTAESSDELLRSYAVKDSDNDGLTDWQESLYGTDPTNPNSFRADMLDGEAARQELLTPRSLVREEEDLSKDLPGTDPSPDSLTEAFSKKFLGQYLLTRGNEPPNEAEVAEFVSKAIDELVRTGLATPRYTNADARIVTGEGSAAFLIYMREVQAVSDAHEPLLEDRDVLYIRKAVEEDDVEALKKLSAMSKTYADSAEALMEVRVPASAVTAHVAMANALNYLSVATADVAAYRDDPIRTMLGIGEYRESIRLVLEALAAMHGPMTRSGVVVNTGVPEYDFYSTVMAAPDALRKYQAAYPTQ
ncbi:MAG: thrombospondin type 3 repeat-containing protein [Patescibacteria group bacterium]